MGLFSKKTCSICGGEIGLLGNRKLEDGNMCKECAKQLSPFFSERRHSTVAEINEQLAYRQANKQDVAAFQPSLTLGKSTKVLIDENQNKFLVSSSSKWRDENPDVIDFANVTGCDMDVQQSSYEEKRKDGDGNMVSYHPARYKFSYDFYFIIRVNNPYFDEIKFKVNNFSISEQGGYGGPTTHSADYDDCESICREIKETIMGSRKEVRQAAQAAAAPKVAVQCRCCGATTIPDEHGRCEFCGGQAV